MTLSAKREQYCQEYIKDLNQTQAALRAGYAKRSAEQQASRLMLNDEVKARIQVLMDERAKRDIIDQDAVLKRWSELAFADPNELTSIRVFACRFCHGNGHQYQWRTQAEFEQALEVYWDLPDDARSKRVAPSEAGGYGYSINLDPVDTCPNCDGLGMSRTVLKDTTKLSSAARALFAGVKETQHGVEVKMHDQMAALNNTARHLGMFPSKVELTGKDGGPIETVTTEMTAEEAAAAYKGTLDADDESDQV